MAFYFSWTNSCSVQCRGGRGRAVWREAVRTLALRDKGSARSFSSPSIASLLHEKEGRGLRRGEREASSFLSARPAGVGADAVTTVRSGHVLVDALKCLSGKSTSEEGQRGEEDQRERELQDQENGALRGEEGKEHQSGSFASWFLRGKQDLLEPRARRLFLSISIGGERIARPTVSWQQSAELCSQRGPHAAPRSLSARRDLVRLKNLVFMNSAARGEAGGGKVQDGSGGSDSARSWAGPRIDCHHTSAVLAEATRCQFLWRLVIGKKRTIMLKARAREEAVVHGLRSPAMGNLIKVLGKDLENCPHFFLDFENAQPTEAETAVWNQVSAVLEEAHGILAELQSYNGAGQEIREAIQNPGDLALQEKAWNAVCPLVAKLKRFYEFSLRLENALRSLLEALTSPPYAPMQHLEREQALAKQFAEILHFTLSFDELKMTNPAIQNDFSYYRRTISRNRLNNQQVRLRKGVCFICIISPFMSLHVWFVWVQLEAENEVNNEMANRMSLFYAEATPMLKTLSNATTKFVSENKTLPIEDTTDCLSTMACVCRVMLETPEYRCRFTNTDTMLFCMRVMVGVIILYDHVHPVGAFAKTSKIDMKGCIKVLKEQPSNSVEGLLNALRYTTRHLNDDSTSKQIRALLQ
ncbi:Protein FAM49A [Oryzias melastigma]|uniref:Protein FAM49A n=6 Tax=Clupeocephala TaxID=186625 RepID=A0A834FD17_ORYME|nr:Protein FAM49A [Oryzias melastigma]